MIRIVIASLLALPSPALADIVKNAGSTTPVAHEKYIHVVSETDSPVQQTHIRTKDGLYVAAAIRKPKGDGPFPTILSEAGGRFTSIGGEPGMHAKSGVSTNGRLHAEVLRELAKP